MEEEIKLLQRVVTKWHAECWGNPAVLEEQPSSTRWRRWSLGMTYVRKIIKKHPSRLFITARKRSCWRCLSVHGEGRGQVHHMHHGIGHIPYSWDTLPSLRYPTLQDTHPQNTYPPTSNLRPVQTCSLEDLSYIVFQCSIDIVQKLVRISRDIIHAAGIYLSVCWTD